MYIDKVKPYRGGILLLSRSKVLNIGIPLFAGLVFSIATFIPQDLPSFIRIILGISSLIAFWVMFRGAKQLQMYGGERFAIINSKGIELFSNEKTDLIPWEYIESISFALSSKWKFKNRISDRKNEVFIWLNKNISEGVSYETIGAKVYIPQSLSLKKIKNKTFISFSIHHPLKNRLLSWIESYSNEKVHIEECINIYFDFVEGKIEKEDCQKWIN